MRTRSAEDDVVPSSEEVPGRDRGRRRRGGAAAREWLGCEPRFRRAIVVVCDGLGVGEAPDAAAFGDRAAIPSGTSSPRRTSASRICKRARARQPHADVRRSARDPRPRGPGGRWPSGAPARTRPTGHWEMTGLVTPTPFPPSPTASRRTIDRAVRGAHRPRVARQQGGVGHRDPQGAGRGAPATGSPILYTSGDSVFQIAAHEELVPPESCTDLSRRIRDRVRCSTGSAA